MSKELTMSLEGVDGITALLFCSNELFVEFNVMKKSIITEEEQDIGICWKGRLAVTTRSKLMGISNSHFIDAEYSHGELMELLKSAKEIRLKKGDDFYAV